MTPQNLIDWSVSCMFAASAVGVWVLVLMAIVSGVRSLRK